ncbi:MAG: hypothetical protein PUB20_00200 [Clostridia bacterium]|nr:hypothetical protein [Clostridia bacterium]
MFQKFNKKAIAVIVAVVAVIAAVGATLAWFSTKSSVSEKFTLSPIKATGEVYFDVNGEKKEASKFADNDGLYILSLDKNDDNYIGNLRMNVKLSGKACVRVRLEFEWNNADGSVAQYSTSVPYVFGDEWYDNRNEDYCVYYMENNGKASFDNLPVISGFDESEFDDFGFDSGNYVRTSIEVDAVQVNRYPQLWGIKNFPWEVDENGK